MKSLHASTKDNETVWRKPTPFIDTRWHAFPPPRQTQSLCGEIFLVAGRGRKRKTMPSKGRCAECVRINSNPTRTP